MAGKRQEDLTPTEVFAQDAYGTPPAPSQYDRFREMARSAVAEGAGLIDGADAKFKAWKAEHPAAQWAASQAGLVSHALGPTAGLGYDLWNSGPHVRNPTSFERGTPTRDPVSFERDTPGVAAGSLPDAPMRPKMAAGMGPGGDVAAGYGSDKGIMNAQLNQIADQSGLQEKKSEEASAHLGVLGVKADQHQEFAQAQAAAANAERQAVDEAEKEQLDHETKWQEASDEAAAMGVDPGRHFKNRDGVFWLNMLVGSVASGMLSALQNQNTNPFMDSVRETVRQDINAQEKGIEQGWRKVKGLETAYERARQRGADRITATIRQYDKTLEALQTDMQGRLVKATIPEVKANLEAGLQAIQIERDGMQVKMEEYWKQVKGQRAAAAAAAADRAWRHAVEMRKLAIEESRTKAQNAKDYAEADKVRAAPDEGAKFIAEKEQAAGLPGLEASVESARQLHQDVPITKAQRFAQSTGLGFQDAPAKYKMMFGEEAAKREQAWAATVTQIRHDFAGANVSPTEAKPIMAMLEGAGDTESRMFALKQAQDVISAKRANIRKAVPDGGRSYDRNGEQIPDDARTPGLGGIQSFKPAGR